MSGIENTLLEKVKKQQQSLRLLKNSETARYQAEALTVVLGEVGRMDKAKVTDESVLKVIKKVYDGILETLKLLPEGNGQEFALINQKEVLSSYLPKMLTREEIRDIIKLIPATTIVEIQKYFKQNYSGKYEGKLVAEVHKEGLCL